MNTAGSSSTILRVPPSPATRRVLVGLAAILRREGTASVRDIGKVTGLASTSTVAYHLTKLIVAGHVEEPVPHRPRGWRLTPLGWSVAATLQRPQSGQGPGAGTLRR
jgi:predicted MarR family transcription regulator